MVSAPREPHFLLVLACFFLSGFAALAYQTAWTREFAFVFGTSDLAVAAVLAAYMAGLALGAALAARLAPRLRRPVLAYGLLELGIALCALAVPAGMQAISALTVAVLGGGATESEPGAVATLFRLGTAFVLLLPPTALMGATLPLLARYAVRTDAEVGPRIGALYATNTAGAIAGTLCAAFLLLPTIGLRQTVYVGAAVNAAVFVLAAWVARGAVPPVAEPAEAGEATDAGGRWILPLILLSGAVSFVYEVMWTRLLSQILGGSVYAFSTMLASFLLGITLGSAIAGRLATDRARSSAGFAWAQIGIAVLSLAAFAAADWLPAAAEHLGAGGIAGALPNAALAGLVLLPFATCIGATFPFAVRIVSRSAAASTAATARVYAWNTVGSIAGSILAGFVLLPWLGFVGTLTAGCAINLGLAIVAGARPPRLAAPLAAAVVVAAVLAFAPIGEPWRLLRTSPLAGFVGPGKIEHFAVGRSSTVMLVEQGPSWKLLTNGLPESVIESKGANPGRHVEARWMGFLPTLLRPEAERALLIGLGGGIALEGMPSTLGAVDVVELEPEVVLANRRIGPRRAIDPLDSDRVRMLVNDARGALMLSETRYDAIVSQPSHPWTAGASHLYTREFFELVRERLGEDGVFVQWIGISFIDEALLKTLIATLLEVFPHVQVYQPVPMALFFAASEAPFDFAASVPEAIRRAGSDLGRYGIHVPEDAAPSLILDEAGARAFSAGARINTDDFNELATRSARLGRDALPPDQLAIAVARFDPLPELAQSLDRGRLARRMARSARQDRIARLAASYDAHDRGIAQGWRDLARGDTAGAERGFRQALAAREDSLEAHAGLLAVGSRHEPAPEAVRLVARANALAEAARWSELANLDDALAREGPGSPLFPTAVRLRIGWRLAERDAEHGAEALSLADRLIERSAPLPDYLLRARAARQAGQPDAAWAALAHISQFLRPGPAARPLARRAASLAAALPENGHRPIRARLARLSR